MPIRCLSSHAMACVVTKRNPVGSEESWLLSPHQALNHPSMPVKLITSLALGCLTLVASLESVAYAAINLASRPIRMFSERPYLLSKELLESSSFTILWSSVDALFLNFVFPNLLTHESFARYWALNFPPAKNLFRLSDQIAIHDWADARRSVLPQNIVDRLLRPIIQNAQVTNKQIEDGANLLAEYVLKYMDADTLERFEMFDSTVASYAISKLIYLYAFGDKKEEAIPEFFNTGTGLDIQKLRKDFSTKMDIAENVASYLKDLKAYEDVPKEEEVKSLFNELRQYAFAELQGVNGSLLIAKCWMRAIELRKAQK